ncbi:hypothetical protein [Pseudanabaena sp. Chao 1811]|uniref:hypothetical protein n=1 Tax=Pseudanabaena sp. Chao 1811 TaxID=2963092 RepID=UPI0022F3D386|nr:hypothetical protein [Pseudanabaena sp. Chao 1811]
MKIAILFWFYKEMDICKNRLSLLRQNNPNIPIYGVYGGDLSTVNDYKLQLEKLLDDFYAFPEDKDSQWKWLQGDLMLTHWYRERGQYLSWDTVAIVQWDMLVFGNIDQLFAMLKQDQILLSGLRPIKEVENDWLWVTPKVPDHREQYLNFLEYVKKTYDYQHEPMGCIFIVVCLPRIFLEAYSKVEHPELGFIEYRIPMYAQIFNIPFCTNHPFQAWWVDGDPVFQATNALQRAINLVKIRLNPNPLNPTRSDISLVPIFRHLNTKKGARIFHPYQYLFPLKKRQWIAALFGELKRDLDWLSRKILGRS